MVCPLRRGINYTSPCLREECAWWISESKEGQLTESGECAIKKLAQEIMYYEET